MALEGAKLSQSGLRCIVPDWPAAPWVRALTTTRIGGASHGPYAGLNLGLGIGDDDTVVRSNRALLQAAIELPSHPLWLRQIHGSRVVHAASGVAHAARADACVADATGEVCAVLTADCLPILLCDRAGTRIAAAHAGWRGLVGGVLDATVAALATDPAELLAWIGPGIGPDAYQVGNEFFDAFCGSNRNDAAAFSCSPQGRWQCNLAELARRRLTRLGVPAVWGGHWCTARDPSRFFSYRRDGVTGRLATLIWIDGSDDRA